MLENANPISTDKNLVENLYFSNKETDYLYKAQISIYGNDISGILIIKKISENNHRVVMTTDFGNKMLDFEISQKHFKVNYLVPDLDREMVKKFLEKDFRMLLNEKYTVSEGFENQNFKIYTSKTGDEKYYLFKEKNSDLLKKIIFTEGGKEKINFSFEAKNPIFADEIELIHKDFKIKINIKKISEN